MAHKTAWQNGKFQNEFEMNQSNTHVHDQFRIVSHLPGGHLPPPKFGHFPPQNSDISHPQKKTFARRTTATPNFFLLFLAHFSWLFRLTAHGGHQGWEGGGA